MSTTGRDLRREREAQRVTATAVARFWPDGEVSRSYISHIERRPHATPRTASRYLAALDTAKRADNIRIRRNVAQRTRLTDNIGSPWQRLSTYVAERVGWRSQHNEQPRTKVIGTISPADPAGKVIALRDEPPDAA